MLPLVPTLAPRRRVLCWWRHALLALPALALFACRGGDKDSASSALRREPTVADLPAVALNLADFPAEYANLKPTTHTRFLPNSELQRSGSRGGSPDFEHPHDWSISFLEPSGGIAERSVGMASLAGFEPATRRLEGGRSFR